MIKPVAVRLRSLLEEDPSRVTCSLIMTGHSAGGAVAALLYAHMGAAHVRSELNILTSCTYRFQYRVSMWLKCFGPDSIHIC